MDAPEALSKLIFELELTSANLRLICHPVGLNWRQIHTTTADKLRHLEGALYQAKPTRQYEMIGSEFIEKGRTLHKLAEGTEVISFISKVRTASGERHLAVMNLHPEDDLEFTDVVRLTNAITGNMPGYILGSGRYYHFYGLRLLDGTEWRRFLASWLMPTIAVSPRYVGHCLHRDYTALRLTAAPPHKPTVPYVRCSMNL